MGLDDFKRDNGKPNKRQDIKSDNGSDSDSGTTVSSGDRSSDDDTIDERNTTSEQDDTEHSDDLLHDNSAAVHDNDASNDSINVNDDSDNSQDTDSGAVDNQSDSDSDTSSTDKGGDETESEDITGGLESFKSTASRGSNNTNTQTDKEESPSFGIEPEKWNSMSKKEIVAEVRDSKIPDFRPEIQLDDRWEYKEVVEIKCVCGNTFYFTTKGLCFECGRSYGKEGRTVVKINDPEGEIIHDSKPDQ